MLPFKLGLQDTKAQFKMRGFDFDHKARSHATFHAFLNAIQFRWGFVGRNNDAAFLINKRVEGVKGFLSIFFPTQ